MQAVVPVAAGAKDTEVAADDEVADEAYAYEDDSPEYPPLPCWGTACVKLASESSAAEAIANVERIVMGIIGNRYSRFWYVVEVIKSFEV